MVPQVMSTVAAASASDQNTGSLGLEARFSAAP